MLVLLALQAPWLFWCVVLNPMRVSVLISSIFVGCVATVLVGIFKAIERRTDTDPGAFAERRVLWALTGVFGLGAISFAWRGWRFGGARGN